jgi:hypothetical protein
MRTAKEKQAEVPGQAAPREGNDPKALTKQ